MEDRRKGNGGTRPGAGRKSRAEELGLKEKFLPMEPDFLKAMAKGLKENNSAFCKMFAEYFYGKPVETIEHSGPDGQPIQTEGKHVVEFRDYTDEQRYSTKD